jgi:hypothetical protein
MVITVVHGCIMSWGTILSTMLHCWVSQLYCQYSSVSLMAVCDSITLSLSGDLATANEPVGDLITNGN